MSVKKLTFLFLLLISVSKIHAQGHNIKFKIKDLNDSIVYLARYFGDNKYIKDTIVVNRSESFTIKGEENLPCGIYLIVREKRNSYMEFIIDKQEFTVISDTSDFINKTTFKDSPENEQLYDYFKYSSKLGVELEKLNAELKLHEENKDSLKIDVNKKSQNELNTQMIDYRTKFIANNPNNPMSVVFNLQKDVDFPTELLGDKSEKGERKRYNYYLEHYWDFTDFSSPCLLRTPVFHSKLQRYFDVYVPQHFDSTIVYIDKLIAKTKVNEELFKYVVNYVSFKWESGKEKRMCWDKVFYHMATNYYMKGLCNWTDSTQLAKISTRAKDLQYVLCGDQAINLQMKYYPAPGLYDTLGVLHDLYKIKADYLILWFWDSDCGHCKTQTPLLYAAYKKFKTQGKNVEVLAINVESESKGYKKYLSENKYEWINVQDTGNFSSFRKYYDIYSTPVAYLLDKNKKLIGKRLDPESLEKFMEQLFKDEEEIKVLESKSKK